MKICSDPWPEVLLYASGMLLVIFGVGAMIVSIDPRPLDISTWKSFLIVGIGFVVVGGIFLVLTGALPNTSGAAVYGRPRDPSLRGFTSAVDLLDDVQSVDRLDASIVKLREASLRDSEESLRTVRSCMMLQNPQSGSDSIFFYKETVV